MNSFLTTSIIASVVLTLALNLIPRLFPNASRRVGERVMREIEQDDAVRTDPGPERPRVRVYFPWKMMLIGSLLLTVLLNAGQFFARG